MKKLMMLQDRLLSTVLIGLMAGIVLVVSWQVLSRYVLNDPSSVTEEIARFLLVWISILGASYAYRTRMHLGLDLMVQKLPAESQRGAAMASHAVVMLFALLVMVIGGGKLVLLAWQLQQHSAALGLPMALIYTVLPLSGVFMLLYGVDFLRTIDCPAVVEGEY